MAQILFQPGYTWIQNPDNEYFILPLDDPENLEKNTGLTNLTDDVTASLDQNKWDCR